MARIYVSYINDRKPGLTWAALVASALILQGGALAANQVIEYLWQGPYEETPAQLRQSVYYQLHRLSKLGFVTYTKKMGSYSITLAGQTYFTPQLDFAIAKTRDNDVRFRARMYSDSVAYNPTKKKTKKNAA